MYYVKSIKYIIFLLNLISALTGLAAAFLCGHFMDALRNYHLSYFYIGTTLGFLVYFVSCLGYTATQREALHLISVYIIFQIFVIILHLCGIFLFSNNVNEFITSGIEPIWSEEIKHAGPMSALEQEYTCCGLNNWEDYDKALLTVPCSCYVDHDCSKTLFKDGCLDKLLSSLGHIAAVLMVLNYITVGVVSTTLICSVILAWILCHHSESDVIINTY